MASHFPRTSSWMPRKIDYPASASLLRSVPTSVRERAEHLKAHGWRFYVTETVRGYCYFDYKVITIPLFAIGKPSDYLAWYVSHEITHAYIGASSENDHGSQFMELLKIVCPANCIHHEAEYKPVAATKAGIFKLTQPMEIV